MVCKIKHIKTFFGSMTTYNMGNNTVVLRLCKMVLGLLNQSHHICSSNTVIPPPCLNFTDGICNGRGRYTKWRNAYWRKKLSRHMECISEWAHFTSPGSLYQEPTADILGEVSMLCLLTVSCSTKGSRMWLNKWPWAWRWWCNDFVTRGFVDLGRFVLISSSYASVFSVIKK